MSTPDVERFHKLYGARKKRINYQDKDFLDYLIMSGICALVLWFGYGPGHLLAMLGVGLCLVLAVAFPLRHGIAWRVPIILRTPQDIVFVLIHKVQNIKAPYFIAIALLLAENALISITPDWPHEVELMRRIAIGLFWAHFLGITAYRLSIMVAHLLKRDHVREVLSQSVWKSRVQTRGMTALEIVHAFLTGLLTHMVYLVPWYLILTHVNYSLVLLPVTCVLAFLVQKASVKTLNDWFYRDHWLGHNSELDFVYLHGTHHDALPSAMIAVAGNGHLEGLVRSAIGFPIPFYNPFMAAFFYTVDVKADMDLHQYIPGVFPKLTKEFFGVIQHSLHHYGRLEPYGFAINLDQPISDDLKKRTRVLPDELKYSIRLDQALNGYEWDSPRFRWMMDLVERYHDEPPPGGAERKANEKKADVASASPPLGAEEGGL